MDTFAHLLWTWIIFGNTPYLAIALFFGIMPDLFSWSIYMFVFYLLPSQKESRKQYHENNRKKRGPPNFSLIPGWVFTLYGLTHSIFVFALVFTVTAILIKSIPYYLLPWIVHIIFDIPTHSREFLPTPFLWPFSNYAFPGFSWGARWFMVTNYVLIAVGIVLRLFVSSS